MNEKRVYPIERLREIRAELDEFNSHQLSEICLTEGGKPIEITESSIEWWKFVGLSNCSFVEFEAWKTLDNPAACPVPTE